MTPIFIGRFQPFHNGHLEAIKWILGKEKEILIIVGSLQEFLTQDNPFSFKERKEMLKRALEGAAPFRNKSLTGFKIFGLPDFFDDLLWVEKALEITKLKKDKALVFTQNSWTKKCFEKIGIKVRPHLIFFNGISATQVRKRVCQNEKWENLIPSAVLNYLKEIKGEERIKFLEVPPEKRIVNFIQKKVKEAKAKGGIVGVSGGLDSSVVAFLTKKALGKRAIFLNINFVKNCHLKENVSLLEKKLKVKIEKIYLGDIYENFLKILPKEDKPRSELALLRGKKIKGNLKPRLRMAALYHFANLDNFLVIGGTNKSEYELGYFTKFGDGGVDIQPLADLYKTEVIELAKRLKLPRKIIETVPSANLWPGQTDEKEIGLNYQKLDTVLKLLKQGFSEKEISFLTNIPENKIGNILERKRKNSHKLLPLPICAIKPEI